MGTASPASPPHTSDNTTDYVLLRCSNIQELILHKLTIARINLELIVQPILLALHNTITNSIYIYLKMYN